MVKNGLLVIVLAAFVAGGVVCAPKPAPAPKAEQPGTAAEAAMTEQQKAEYVAANCICAQCPSFLKEECAKAGEKGGYCLAGKSKVITKENGCICGNCPVTAKMGLKWGYYCTRGSAAEMMAMEAQKQAPAGGK